MMRCAKVGILFPNGIVSKSLATKLLQTNYNVVFYCPEKEDFKECKKLLFFFFIIIHFFHLHIKFESFKKLSLKQI